MATRWKPILIRIAEGELGTFKEFCAKQHIKMTELFRSGARVYVAYPELVNGIVKVGGNSTDIQPLVESINKLTNKVEALDRKLSTLSVEKDSAQPLVENRIMQAVVKIKQRAKRDVTTVERLREQLLKADPSLAPFLFASSTRPISPLDEVLGTLEAKGELHRKYGGVLKFNKVIDDA